MYAILNTKTKKGSPPLTRGIHIGLADENKIVGITPAYAGNTRRRECQRVMWWDHPRLRGEYRCREKVTLTQEGSPPLTRGIPISGDCLSVRVGITPAYAGNTTTYGFLEIVAEDHPRLRGEYCQTSAHQRFLAGSPPLTRGIHSYLFAYDTDTRITPAYAGNTSCCCSADISAGDHPRLRGEYTKRIPYLQHFPTLRH